MVKADMLPKRHDHSQMIVFQHRRPRNILGEGPGASALPEMVKQKLSLEVVQGFLNTSLRVFLIPSFTLTAAVFCKVSIQNLE